MNIDAQQLKQLRTSKAWTQQQLADASGLSLRTIQRLERYGTGASESVLCVAAALSIDSSVLISDTNFEVVSQPQAFSLPQLIVAALVGAVIGAISMVFFV